jgi:hypothetical protein
MLSFGFNCQSLAQSSVDNQSHANKIKISADNPPVPSYLSHSKKALQIAEKQKEKQKKDSLWTVISKMLKALFLAIALFFALIAILVKNKDKFNFKQHKPVSANKTIKQSEPEKTAQNIHEIKPEIISGDKQIRNLVFKFFNINK